MVSVFGAARIAVLGVSLTLLLALIGSSWRRAATFFGSAVEFTLVRTELRLWLMFLIAWACL